MTRHISEDTLIQLALGLLDTQAEESVRRHLGECPACRAAVKDVEKTLQQLMEVTPQVTADIPAFPAIGHSRYEWLRIAAVLAVGIGLGFIGSESLRSPSMNVQPQQIAPKTPDQSPDGFVACDEIDLSWEVR